MKKNILSAAFSLVCFALPGSAGLVAHYKFDEIGGDGGDTIAANQVPGGATGQIGSRVVTYEYGKIGGCFYFPGGTDQADIVDMGNASFLPEITTNGQLTFSVWILTNDITGNHNTVVSAVHTGVSNVYADMGVTSGLANYKGAVRARIRPPQQGGLLSYPEATPEEEPEGRVNDFQWHHLAMTVSRSAANPAASTISVYVDGELANSSSVSLTSFPSFNLFQIGRLTRLNGSDLQHIDPYEGYVDDVQVYSIALTPEEVLFLHDNPGEVVVRSDPPADLVITSAEIDGEDFRISFTGAPSTTYSVRGSLDLEAFDIDEGTATTDGDGGGEAAVPLVPGRPRQFYRIEEITNP